MRLIGGQLPADPGDRENYCLAAANPGTFYGKDQDGNPVSGTEIVITAEADASEECGGSGAGDRPTKSFAGYFCPESPSAINFSMAGSAALPKPSRGGGIASADYGAGTESGSQQAQEGEGDCCDTTSDFGSDWTSGVYPKCCPIAVSATVRTSVPCDGEDGTGVPAEAVTVTISAVPEA
jgi:hypothetical protein